MMKLRSSWALLALVACLSACATPPRPTGGGFVTREAVVDGERPVGIVSLGDLAAALDEGSVLGQISTAPPDE